jgi:Txe/YoeB family toxin of Txe-Axe toxin-antitoxin module
MRAIDKFILHVVHNWKNELNEAYSEKAVKGFIDKFKEEADDLNIQVTDDQLKSYIERFDVLKNSPNVTEKDLNKWTLSKLIRLVTSTKGAEAPEEAENTPDVVYNQDGLTIYNGSKEDNCLNYGRGESWCITRGSFGNYRYDTNRKNPTFYLVKDSNLSDSDRKSFFVVVVGSDNTYKASDRSNNDVGGRATEWDRWESWSFIEQNFPSITGLRNIFKYIPLSSSEKLNQSYKNNPATIREFIKFPYSVKEQYLVVRKGRELFTDVSTDEFVEKYLPKYPQLASFISTNYGIIPSEILVKHLDKFSNQDTRSIISNMRDKVKSSLLSSETIPFEVKKFLVKFDKWTLDPSERLYVTKDGNAIVKLTIGDDIKIGVYTEEDDYPSIKLNKRTSKYLIDYPELDKIPFKNLIKLASEDVIDKSLVDKVVENAKNDPNSAIVVKTLEDGTDILLDSNSFASYKIENGRITQIPFDNEDVQQIFNDSKDNEAVQDNVIGMLNQQSIPGGVDREGLLSVLKATPYSRRITDDNRIVLTTDDPSVSMFSIDPRNIINLRHSYVWGDSNNNNWRRRGGGSDYIVNPNVWQSYFAYLRSMNRSYDSNELLRTLKLDTYGRGGIDAKKAFIRANPPITADNMYRPVMNGDIALLINLQNPRESFQVSDRSGKLNRAVVPTALARQLTGQGQPAAGQVAAQVGGVARRGRPASQPNAPQPAAPAAEGNVNVGALMQGAGIMNGFMDLPRPILRRLNVNNANSVTTANNRGASRRQNILGANGRVVRVLEIGPSTIYFITLPNSGVTVASVVVQPGNGHYLITPQSAYQLESPSQLLQALQQRNLAEVHQYLVNEYMERNPEHLTEFKELLRKHINEKKNANK